jgi:hypothetical protein
MARIPEAVMHVENNPLSSFSGAGGGGDLGFTNSSRASNAPQAGQ